MAIPATLNNQMVLSVIPCLLAEEDQLTLVFPFLCSPSPSPLKFSLPISPANISTYM